MYTKEMLVVGAYEANCYLLESEGKLVIIDPGEEAPRIISAIGNREVSAIILTHCHSDHIGAVNELVEATGAPVYVGKGDDIGVVDPHLSGFDEEGSDYVVEGPLNVVSDGGTISWGGDTFDVISTPGHTPGSICLYNADSNVLFTGDTLFPNGYGSTEFVRGDENAIRDSMKRLAKFSDSTVFFPGHGLHSTIGIEKGRNPWLVESE